MIRQNSLLCNAVACVIGGGGGRALGGGKGAALGGGSGAVLGGGRGGRVV